MISVTEKELYLPDVNIFRLKELSLSKTIFSPLLIAFFFSFFFFFNATNNVFFLKCFKMAFLSIRKQHLDIKCFISQKLRGGNSLLFKKSGGLLEGLTTRRPYYDQIGSSCSFNSYKSLVWANSSQNLIDIDLMEHKVSRTRNNPWRWSPLVKQFYGQELLLCCRFNWRV